MGILIALELLIVVVLLHAIAWANPASREVLTETWGVWLGILLMAGWLLPKLFAD